MRTRLRLYVMLVACILVWLVGQGAGGQASLAELFRLFQAPSTSDEAAKQLLELGRSDREARMYLAARLPAIIERGPTEQEVWLNAVFVAGALKLAEACAPLTRWVGA